MRIAVLANPGAGGGGKAGAALEKLRAAWAAHELIGAEGFGGESLSVCLPRPEAEDALPYVPALQAAAGRLLAAEPELCVTVGGDGTAAYAAEELLRRGAEVPLFGLGTGTANVGPIVSCRLEDELPDPAGLREERFGAMEVLTLSGEHIAYGFNDLGLGNTFLGTDPDGVTVTFEAAALARDGVLKKAAPLRDILSPEGCFAINGRALPPVPYRAAQLIASAVDHENYYGRAVAGLLCFTPGSAHQGAVYISPTPIVSVEESTAGFESWLTGGQLLLSPADVLEIRRPHEAVCAVADGNPYRIPRDGAALRYVPACIKIARRS